MGTGTGMSPAGMAALASTEGDRSHPTHGHSFITLNMRSVEAVFVHRDDIGAAFVLRDDTRAVFGARGGCELHSGQAAGVADRPRGSGGVGAAMDVSGPSPVPSRPGSTARGCSRLAAAWQPAQSHFSWEKPHPVSEPNKKSSELPR